MPDSYLPKETVTPTVTPERPHAVTRATQLLLLNVIGVTALFGFLGHLIGHAYFPHGNLLVTLACATGTISLYGIFWVCMFTRQPYSYLGSIFLVRAGLIAWPPATLLVIWGVETINGRFPDYGELSVVFSVLLFGCLVPGILFNSYIGRSRVRLAFLRWEQTT